VRKREERKRTLMINKYRSEGFVRKAGKRKRGKTHRTVTVEILSEKEKEEIENREKEIKILRIKNIDLLIHKSLVLENWKEKEKEKEK
jgi:hypothetical protein